jgi:hypothetical protein
METYLGEARGDSLDSNDLGNSLVGSGGVVDELRLHNGVVLEVGGLISSLVEVVALGGEGGQTVSLSEDDLTLDTLDVASVSYYFKKVTSIESYRGSASGELYPDCFDRAARMF